MNLVDKVYEKSYYQDLKAGDMITVVNSCYPCDVNSIVTLKPGTYPIFKIIKKPKGQSQYCAENCINGLNCIYVMAQIEKDLEFRNSHDKEYLLRQNDTAEFRLCYYVITNPHGIIITDKRNRNRKK